MLLRWAIIVFLVLLLIDSTTGILGKWPKLPGDLRFPLGRRTLRCPLPAPVAGNTALGRPEIPGLAGPAALTLATSASPCSAGFDKTGCSRHHKPDGSDAIVRFRHGAPSVHAGDGGNNGQAKPMVADGARTCASTR